MNNTLLATVPIGGQTPPPTAAAPDAVNTAKSPLRYPGGKSRAVQTILSYIPQDTRALCAPFLGGGSVELACNARGIHVYASDAFAPLIIFWQMLKHCRYALAERVERYYPLSRSRFYELQKTYTIIGDKLERAAAFYVLNRSSFSGTTLSGGMSPGHPRFTRSSIERLRTLNLNNMRIAHCDYRHALQEHSDMILYLDPPYDNGGRLYGIGGDLHDGFDHAELVDILKKRDGWILSYSDCPMVRNLYANYTIVTPKWQYGMSKQKKSNEVLILNV